MHGFVITKALFFRDRRPNRQAVCQGVQITPWRRRKSRVLVEFPRGGESRLSDECVADADEARDSTEPNYDKYVSAGLPSPTYLFNITLLSKIMTISFR